MLVVLELLLLLYGVSGNHCATVPANSTDMLSLLDFRKAINDPTGALNNWNASVIHCQWKGVTCATKHPGRVTVLNLTGQGLSGPIHVSVGNLTFLRMLDLSTNSFSGQIPPLINLHKLRFLDLGTNSMEGIFPDWLTNCSSLLYLDLLKNRFVGTIPPKIGLLSNLANLRLSFNNFTGTIPPTFNNITNLQQMVIASNQLEGTIPNDLGKLSNLQSLSLAENNLTGEIPHTFYNLSSLRRLTLRRNKLSKALAPDIGDKLPNLEQIFLSENMFADHIPVSLSNASGLIKVDLSTNVFTGQVPSSFGKLSGLLVLNLDENDLEASDSVSWEFLHAMRNCSSLQVLSLAENKLTGPIPDSIGNLSKTLQNLVLRGNKLSGIVPESVGKHSELILLTLDFNFLTGTIGEWIGKLKNLQGLILQNNNFIGPIPSSIGNLTYLTELYLKNNAFEGHIPPSMGNPLLLLELDLSYNKLQGTIPLEISKLGQLVYLQLTSDKLNGVITDALGMCQNLVTIQMDRNFLTGDIPITFSKLESLTILNLSHNNLSGTIPVALGYLPLLSKLDLSYSSLHGEVPTLGVFRKASFAYLDGNSGLCGGVTDLHMLSCPQNSIRTKRDSNITKRDYYLDRLLIPIFGFGSLVVLIYLTYLAKKTSRRAYLLLLSFGKQFPRVSYKDLARATGNFSESNLIGRGCYGTVYRAKLAPAKIKVSIMVFDLEVRCADKSFLSECEVLRCIRHRNILPILTACSTIDNSGTAFKALIYEYMPNGNVDKWLHKQFADVASKCLSLAQRVSIAVDIANALSYLHHECERRIVHCDLKPTNILLDDDMNAYLGDFGISSLILESRFASPGHSSPNSSIGLKGTIGYIAPEYAQCGHASTYGDVYSFGIVLLEVLIGKRPTDSMFENEINIVNFVEKNFPKQIPQIIDARLQEECKGVNQAMTEQENGFYICLFSAVEVALSCTRLIPRERMNTREVASKLHAIRTSYAEATKRENTLCKRELECVMGHV